MINRLPTLAESLAGIAPRPRSVQPRGDRASTKDRILAATAKLFVQNGFDATSLRAITTEASVNLAAVNYHFGSKEELFSLVLTSRLDKLIEQRVQRLDTLETRGYVAGQEVEQLIAVLFYPALQMAHDEQTRGEDFLRFLGRAYADPSPFVRGLLAERYAKADERFARAFAAVLPNLTQQDLTMRLHFMFDAISSTLASEDARKLLHSLTADDTEPEDLAALAHIAPFLGAALRSPVKQPSHYHALKAALDLN